MTLIAYHGDAAVKAHYLERVTLHEQADEIIKGTYGIWDSDDGDLDVTGKGCAVGCTLHGNKHVSYEDELGVPQILARLEDRIFEGAPDEWSKTWPRKFLEAIKPGSDLSVVWPQFAVWLLVDSEHGVIRHARSERSLTAIRNIAAAYERNDVKREEWLSLRADADAAAAAYAAAAAAAAAYADADAAAAADAAAYAAAYAAADAYAAAAAAAARSKAYQRQGEKLLELMAAAPLVEKP